MASQVKTPARSANAQQTSASVRQAQKVKDYVNVELEKTRKQVKIVDLIASVLLMLASVVGVLLLLVIVDAWIWPLSTSARWAGLILIVGGCLAYSAIAILPLLLKQINPDYAAKMIEEAKPSFRNSLINYVSFRKRPDEIKPAVFDAVSRQAAADLASVPGDATVDQSKLIRLGFVLIGLTVFAVGYKMLSPKDPLQTLARVVAPAAQIAKPAVVRIEDVQPGDTAVFFGEQLVVTATVRGQHRPEDVRLVYSTLDGQLSDQTVSMKPTSSPSQYETKLSMAGGGIQSSLQYRVEALDGQSPDYTVTVRPNPSIAIESLILSPPAYTKMAERTLTGVGDIEAIEGTQVTVHAVANLPIKIAYIELLKDVGDANQAFGNVGDTDQENRFRTMGASIKMAVEGKSAVARFPIFLDTTRTQAFASHYRVRFVSTDDDRNSQPNVYPIRVIPDLAPEIKFRNPVKSDVQLPINGVLAIDVQANDLDFVLTEIRLKVDQAGSKRLDKSLQMFSTDDNRRATARYLLRPSEMGLIVGDRAVFVATAADNRVSHSSGQPDPNVSRTANYSVTIVEFDQETEEAKGEDPGENADSPKNDDPSEQDGNEKGDPKENSGDDGGASGDEPGEQDGDSGSESESGEEGEAGSDEGTGQSGGAASDTPEGDPEANGSEGAQGGAGNNDPGANQPSDPKNNAGDGGSGDPSGNGDQSEKPEGGTGSASDGTSNNEGDGNQPPDQNQPREGGEPQDSSDDGNSGEGTQDSSLTEGAKEKMSDAPPGAQMQQLEEYFDEEDGPDEPQDSEASDTPSDDSSTDQPTKQTGDPTTGDSGNSTGNDQPGTPEQGAPGDGNPSEAKPDPAESEDPKSNDPETGDPTEGNPNEQKAGDPESGEELGKPSNNNQPTENQSSSQGSPEGNQGPDPDGPKNDTQKPAEDSDDNQRAREQSAKSGLEDATGRQSQDPGGHETDKTGNESGGADPGESKDGDDPGENPGESDAGNPGSEPGDGNSKADSPQGNEPGQEGSKGDSGQPKPGDGTAGDSGQPGGESAQPSGQPSEANGGEGDSGDSGSNSPSDEQGEPKQPSQPKPSDGNSENTGGGGGGGGSGNEALERDAKNLEHARNATELVLKKLADQRYDPDPKLLEKMNWTKDDLAKFLDRWEEMRRAAQAGGDAEKRKYDRSLRSLNLRPKNGGRIVDQLDERSEGISEDSRVNRPTPELAPDFNAFMKDLNRTVDDN